MDSKDARDSSESGLGGARCRCSNGRRKVAAVFVIQSLLTAVCAAVSLNIYLSQEPGSSKQHFSQDRGIYLQMIPFTLSVTRLIAFSQIMPAQEVELTENTSCSVAEELQFNTLWNQSVALNDKKTVRLSCGGPYMVYMWACVSNISTEAVANLTINTGTELFHLQTLRGKECKKMQKVIMLDKKQGITVKLERDKGITITELFLGLHYMLGAQCFPSPIDNDS